METREPRGGIVSLARLVALTLSALLTSFFVSCGQTRPSQPLAHPSGPRDRIPLARIFQGIDARPVPTGVSADNWSSLTAELKRLLSARAAVELKAGIGDGKSISAAPSGTLNVVTDLRASSNASGTQATLTWTDVLPGDYDNDGTVDIVDLQPVALYYGQRTDAGANDAHRIVDGDGDPEINIVDLQAIAANYASHLQGYRVCRGNHATGVTTIWESTYRPNVSDPVNSDWSADRPSPPPISARPAYTYLDDISSLTDKDHVRFKVIAFGDGAAGATSLETSMTPPTYFIVSGSVTNSVGGSGVAGVTLTLTPSGATATTAGDGTYAIYNVPNGAYTLTPSMPGWTFVPTSSQVTVADASLSGMNFVGTLHTYSISGSVLNGTKPVSGVKPTLTPGGLTATTDNFGTYTIGGVIDGSYTLTPAKGGYVFTPPNRAVDVAGADVTAQSFDGVAGLANSAWPKFRQNPANTGQSPYNGPAATPTLKWTFTTGAEVDSSPSIAEDGTIYVGSNDNNVYALNPTDGSLKWKRATLGPVTSSPAVARDGTIYIGSGQPDDSLYALNPADGSIRWRFIITSEVSSSPAISDDGTVYVGGTDKNVYALNPSDGSIIWQFTTGQSVISSPAIGADGTIYIGSNDTSVYALNPLSGTPKWSYKTSDTVNFAPALATDTLYVPDNGWPASMYAIALVNGSLKWTQSITVQFGVSNSPTIALDGSVIVSDGRGNTKAFNPSDGSVKWSVSLSGSPTCAAVGLDGTLFIGSALRMYALSPVDGSTIWSYAAPAMIVSSPCIAADGTLYFGCTDGKLYALGP